MRTRSRNTKKYIDLHKVQYFYKFFKFCLKASEPGKYLITNINVLVTVTTFRLLPIPYYAVFITILQSH
jgi:hypothetical protein